MVFLSILIFVFTDSAHARLDRNGIAFPQNLKSPGTCKFIDHPLLASLSSQQRDAICGAASYFDIDFYTKGDQTILLMGENHIHFDVDWEAGKKVVNSFSLRAYEGFPMNHYRSWLRKFGYALEDQVLRIFSVLWQQEDLHDSLTRLAASSSDHRLYFDGKAIHLESDDPALKTFVECESRELALGELSRRAGTISIHLETDREIMEALWRECPETVLTGKPLNCPKRLLVTARNNEFLEGILQISTKIRDRGPLLVVMGAEHLSELRSRFVCEEGFTSFRATKGLTRVLPQLDTNQDTFSPEDCQ